MSHGVAPSPLFAHMKPPTSKREDSPDSHIYSIRLQSEAGLFKGTYKKPEGLISVTLDPKSAVQASETFIKQVTLTYPNGQTKLFLAKSKTLLEDGDEKNNHDVDLLKQEQHNAHKVHESGYFAQVSDILEVTYSDPRNRECLLLMEPLTPLTVKLSELGLDEKIAIFKDCINAMKRLDEQGLCYLDFHLGQICLTDDSKVKIVDFESIEPRHHLNIPEKLAFAYPKKVDGPTLFDRSLQRNFTLGFLLTQLFSQELGFSIPAEEGLGLNDPKQSTEIKQLQTFEWVKKTLTPLLQRVMTREPEHPDLKMIVKTIAYCMSPTSSLTGIHQMIAGL